MYKYVFLKNHPVISSLSNKIVAMGIDTNYLEGLDLRDMLSLKELRVRISLSFEDGQLRDLLTEILSKQQLTKVVLEFPSSKIPTLLSVLSKKQTRARIVLIISLLNDTDADNVRQLIALHGAQVGIKDVKLNAFHSFFLTEEAVLLPQTRRYFKVSKTIKEDEKFQQLYQMYLPTHVEVTP